MKAVWRFATAGDAAVNLSLKEEGVSKQFRYSSLTSKLLEALKMFNLIAWVVLGILAGAIAKAIYPGPQGGGILGTIVLGIIGAFVGGSLLTLFNGGGLQLTAMSAPLSIPGVFVAVLGAIVAIFIWNLITRSRTV